MNHECETYLKYKVTYKSNISVKIRYILFQYIPYINQLKWNTSFKNIKKWLTKKEILDDVINIIPWTLSFRRFQVHYSTLTKKEYTVTSIQYIVARSAS